VQIWTLNFVNRNGSVVVMVLEAVDGEQARQKGIEIMQRDEDANDVHDREWHELITTFRGDLRDQLHQTDIAAQIWDAR
jgi:hypothetical protein